MTAPPHNLVAERAVLGAMLLQTAFIPVVQVDMRLVPGDFYQGTYGNVYESVCRLADEGRGVDEITVSVDLQEHEQEAPSDLNELAACAPSAGNVRDYARVVRELSLRRRVLREARVIEQEAFTQGDVRDLISAAEQRILNIEDATAGQLASLSMDIEGELARLEAVKGGNVEIGVPTGLKDVDELLSGWQPDNLVIVAARPGMGKSAFAIRAAQNAASEGHPVAMFSLEMSRGEILRRIIAAMARVPGQALMKGPVNTIHFERIHEAVQKISKWPLYVDESPDLSVTEARAKARRLHAKHPLGLIIIDYLQLMRTDNAENRNVEVGRITRGLKVLAKELHVPVIAVSQLSRGVESRPSKKPTLADLRDSGSVEQDADIVTFLYRDSYYNPDADPGEAELMVAKYRNGPTGNVKLTFLDAYPRFENYIDPARFTGAPVAPVPF